jgi:hypothetical protein
MRGRNSEPSVENIELGKCEDNRRFFIDVKVKEE